MKAISGHTFFNLAAFGLLLLSLPAACQSGSTSPIKQTPDQQMQTIAPGTIQLIARVISSEADAAACKLEVLKLLGEGSGIVNPLSEGQQFVAINLAQPAEEQPVLKKGALVEVHLRESLSLQGSTPAYEIFAVQPADSRQK